MPYPRSSRRAIRAPRPKYPSPNFGSGTLAPGGQGRDGQQESQDARTSAGCQEHHGPAAPRRRTAKAAAPAVAAAVGSEGAVADRSLAGSIDYAEQVRIRAYFLHLERRGRPGNPVEDWLAAERDSLATAGAGRRDA